MTTCETIQPRLTAYLDGDLADDHGSVVRGHLRECAACRQIARDEAALRDGLRMLPPVDPPAALWAGVQAQLAAAEVADARQPGWRRAVARWTPWTRWRWLPAMPPIATLPGAAQPGAAQVPQPMLSPEVSVPAAGDVTAELIAEPARTTASYDQVIEELMKLARDARADWTDERKAAFDARFAALRDRIAHAGSPRAQQRASGSLIHYLQGAVIRDDVLLASGGVR
jgi:hypothetical protein